MRNGTTRCRSTAGGLPARLGGRIPGGRALEIGCVSGYGTQLILDRFVAAAVDAVDLDPGAVDSARRRLAGYEERVRPAVASATDLRAALEAEDDGFDAVFDFAIIHHVEDWRAAVAEVARVLRPGGRFYFDEVTVTALNRPTCRRLFDHPGKDWFTVGDFPAELPRHGLYPDERWLARIGGDHLLGVAELRPTG
ncbi:class I SAM-dependent methyltransferase [Streptomyces sp. NPDC001795]|uniref:class I SAM-dependent methyltransferase n=1 Tax=Streptomyces sp. NPDC001795 TaxID=3154525 RepID=UPI0033200417